MQIINTTSTSKALLGNKTNTSKCRAFTSKKQQTSRHSSTKETKTYNEVKSIPIPVQQNSKYKKQNHTPEEKNPDSIFDIVYNTTAQLITPPPSPKSSPLASKSFEANDRVLSAKNQGQLKALMSEYTALKKESLLFTDHTYNLIFDSYVNLRRDGTPLTPMLKIYDEMLRSQIQPSSSTYAILIRALCKRDVEVQKVVAMLKRQSARSSAYKNKSNNMSELESEENIQKALDIFDAAVSQSLVRFFDAELYNQILRVLSHYGNTEKSLYVYRQLELHSTPTSATYAALINLFGRVGDLGSALFFFNRYKQLKDCIGHHDASYIYNALVDAHLKCDKLDGALKIIKEDMISADIKITTIPYNSVIRYFCLKNRLEEAKQFVVSMKEAFPQPDASSYGPILSSYCQTESFQEANEMYQSLIQTDISKSYGNLANYALLCLKNKENSNIVLQIIKDMHAAGLEPDASLVERIMLHFVKLDQVPQAIAALRTVLESKPRSLAKGIVQIKNTAIQVAAAGKGNFEQVLEVARLIFPHGLPRELANILVEEYKVDSNVTQSDYSIVFDAAIAIKSDGATFIQLYNDMTSKGFKGTFNIKSRVLSYLIRSGDKVSVYNWESLFKKAEIPVAVPVVPVNTIPAAVSEADKAAAAVLKTAIAGQLEESLDILRNRIVSANLVPSPEPLRDAIAFIGKQGHLQIAVNMYHAATKIFEESGLDTEHIERAVYMMTNSILIGYAQQGDMDNAKKYYEQIKSMGRYPDGNGYASLLLGSANCATDEATDALTIYDEAKRRGVKPTTFFYNVVISKLAKARKLDPAMKLFEEMQTFKVVPNSITFGAIISACVRAGSELWARKLFSDMLASPSFQPRVGPFNNMIQFYVRQQPDRKRALEYFSEMRRRQIKPSAHTYKLLMEAYSLIAPYDMSTAHLMLNDMERCDHIRPEATHYATLIYSYGTLQQDVKSAQRVFKDMIEKKVKMDEVVYQAMIDTYISNDQLSCAETLYTKMQTVIQKSSSPYIENLFIRGYGQKGLLDEAKAMFNVMTDERANEETSKVREPSTYEAMVRAYIQNNRMAEAKRIFELMLQREFPEKVTALVAELVNV